MSKRQSNPGQKPLPIQPVGEPILCSPYVEPDRHWHYDERSGEARIIPGRRPASYWVRSERVGMGQMSLFGEESREDINFINDIREDVRRWRKGGYENATQVTKQLLAHWWRADRPRRLFFAQLEAAETIIYLHEIRLPGRYTRFRSDIDDNELRQKLQDIPANPDYPPLPRMGIKMATGSGKTVVMAMLIAWAFCNRGRVPGDDRFPKSILIACPNLTVKERLQVLQPGHPENYHAEFDLVPHKLRPLLHSGKIHITNWHQFAPESPHHEGGQSYSIVNKGEEGPEAFARRVLGDLYDNTRDGGLLIFNDEGHHAWRPKPDSKVDKSEQEEATVWVDGLDRLNTAVGVRAAVDFSATPFYIQGSGYIEGAPFPWLVSDFGLVDAIECGIVKIPRLPVSDTTGRPEPKYFRLWENIRRNLQPGEFLPGRGKKPKPEAVYREAEPALLTLAGQWKERFEYIHDASDTQDKTPPVLIIVCDNTDIAEYFYRQISGEHIEETVEQKGKRKTKKRITVYGQGRIFPEHFSNTAEFPRRTVRIDSKLLEKAESGDPNLSRQDAAEQLRRIVSTVGKPGEPGEQVRCVVSVSMLTEGWDANNVTHIFGLRAFTSQLLCEQVVGRGLRRMDYTPDPETGMLTEEYVDIYGVPFSLIPFKGRKTQSKAPEDKPKNHVHALPERAHLAIRFPVVEGYAASLQKNAIVVDVDEMEPLRLEPELEPTAVFVKPRVVTELGAPTLTGPGETLEHDRHAFYETTHLQTIEFEIARQVMDDLLNPSGRRADLQMRLQARHQLFPQILRYVHAYVDKKVDFRGLDPRELGQKRYMERIVGRMLDAIQPDETVGEPPLLPILNRYAPIGTTADVDFKTTRPVKGTIASHINAVPTHTQTWENSAAFYLELAAKDGVVRAYARNDGLDYTIPYEYYGISHSYEPDFLAKLIINPARPQQDVTLIIEVKGYETDQDRAKHQAARRWVAAVNNWGKLGRWDFHVTRDPHLLRQEVAYIRSRWQKEDGVGETAVVATPDTPPTPEKPATPTKLPQEWLDSIKVAPECQPLLRQCFQAGLPLPEVGYETRDRQRHQAELAWETLNVAVFLPDYAADKAAFAHAGWQTFMIEEKESILGALKTKIA